MYPLHLTPAEKKILVALKSLHTTRRPTHRNTIPIRAIDMNTKYLSFVVVRGIAVLTAKEVTVEIPGDSLFIVLFTRQPQ